MPNRPTAKKGFACKPDDCYAQRHLKPNLFKMYDLMLAFAKAGAKSRGHSRLVCTASVRPTLCNAYPSSESNAIKLIEELCDAGWLVKHQGGQGRDKKTGHLLPNIYEVIEHTEFVTKHPGSCPPYPFAPDFETAEAYGLQRGDRIVESDVPENFQKVFRTPLGQAIGAWLSTLTDADRAAMNEHYKTVKFAPEDPAEHERRLKHNAEVRKLAAVPDLTVPANAETVPSPQTRRRTVSANEVGPSPHLDEDRLRKRGGTVPTNAERILEDSNLENANLEKPPHTTTGSETPSLPRPARRWLSLLWSRSLISRSEEKQTGLLTFRPPKIADEESPDITLIENLIEKDGEKNVIVYWAEFCFNFNHDPATKFPMTVFARPENYATCVQAANDDAKQWKEYKEATPAVAAAQEALRLR